MTLEQFKKATDALKGSVLNDHYMVAELSNGQEQAIMDNNGWQSDWDEEMVFCTNHFDLCCAAFLIKDVVRIYVK